MRQSGTDHQVLLDTAQASDGAYSAGSPATLAQTNDGGGFPTLFSDEEFDELQQKRNQAERSEHERMDNAGIRAKPTATDGLPETTIEQRFKHIAKQLTGMWPSEACSMYIKNLVISERGTRQGFPQDVVDDLMMLYQINEMHCRTIGVKLQKTGERAFAPLCTAPPKDAFNWTSITKR